MLDTHVATIMVIAVGHQGNMKHIGLYAVLGGLLGTTEHRIGVSKLSEAILHGHQGPLLCRILCGLWRDQKTSIHHTDLPHR